MVVLYSVAAVILACAVFVFALTGVIRALLDHQTLKRHDRDGQNGRILNTLVKIRSVETPSIVINIGWPFRRRARDDSDR